MADYANDPLRCIVCDAKFFTYGDLAPHENECLKKERERRQAQREAAEGKVDA